MSALMASSYSVSKRSLQRVVATKHIVYVGAHTFQEMFLNNVEKLNEQQQFEGNDFFPGETLNALNERTNERYDFRAPAKVSSMCCS